MLPALGALTSLTGGGALTPSSSAPSTASNGPFMGGTTGDFNVNTTSKSQLVLWIVAAAIGLFFVWRALRK